jgi:hypothetical protein
MKLNRMITLCAMASALALSVGDIFAQNNGGNNGNNGNNGAQGGGQRRNRQQGQPGQGGQGGQFDPAAFQQQMVDRTRDPLGFTNDTDWSAVEPLVQKVIAAQFDARAGQGRGMFGGRNRGGQGGGPGGQQPGRAGQTNPEADALQKALDDNAPASQIKDLLAKYKAVQKAKQAKLEAAQADLKKVLTTKQEAQAVLLGLVN